MEEWKQEHLSVFKELAQEEFKIKDKYDSIIAFPMTSISAMSGYMYYMVTKTASKPYDSLEVVFLAISGCYYLAFVYTLGRLLQVFHGKGMKYDDLPLAEDLSNYQDALIKYHKEVSVNEEDVKPNFVRNFNKVLMDYYIQIATNNSEMNKKKRVNYEKARVGLIVCAILFIGASLIALYKMLFL